VNLKSDSQATFFWLFIGNDISDLYGASVCVVFLRCTSFLFFMFSVVAMVLLLKDPEPDVRIRAAEAISHLLNI